MKDTNIDTENTVVNSAHAEPEKSRMQKTLELISQSKAESAKSADKVVAVDEIVERSAFEKSLYPNDEAIIDFKNYHFAPKLFNALNKEAKEGIELKYSDYKKSLLNVLQHCYGYYYQLMTTEDKKGRKIDIEYINGVIAGENITSNANNSLHAKIIKLTWRGTNIGSKRISTYASLLGNAFTKGNIVDGVTDKNGSILPKHFIETVTQNGGINAFSRISAKSMKEKEALKAEGFDSKGEKALSAIKDAIKTGEFTADVENSKIIAIEPIELSTEFNGLTDGDFGVVLVKYDSNAAGSVEPIYASTDTGKVDTLLRKFYSKLEKQSIPKVEKPLVIKYKKSELRKLKAAIEILDINGGDVESFLNTIHVDREKLAAVI